MLILLAALLQVQTAFAEGDAAFPPFPAEQEVAEEVIPLTDVQQSFFFSANNPVLNFGFHTGMFPESFGRKLEFNLGVGTVILAYGAAIGANWHFSAPAPDLGLVMGVNQSFVWSLPFDRGTYSYHTTTLRLGFESYRPSGMCWGFGLYLLTLNEGSLLQIVHPYLNIGWYR